MSSSSAAPISSNGADKSAREPTTGSPNACGKPTRGRGGPGRCRYAPRAVGDEFGPWEPLSTAELTRVFEGAPFRWWVTGGVALELFMGRSWREHEDSDIGICRLDAGQLYRWMDGFVLFVAAGGRLRPWDGRALRAARSENNVWAKHRRDGAWCLDITIGEGDDLRWVYRRDPTVQRSWAETVRTNPQGMQYLAPEIQLLFKAKGLRPKDTLDADVVIGAMEPERRAWLGAHLPVTHPWQELIARPRR
jgi:hypothetical protein